MPAIIECVASQSGLTLYTVIHNSTGQLWNTSGQAFEAYNSAHWANYVISLTEQSPTAYYFASFPTQIVAGKYTEVFYQGTGIVGDLIFGSSSINWNGTSEEQGIFLGMNATVLSELNAIPSATPTFAEAIMMLYMSIRNRHSATAIQETISNSAGTTIGSATLSDDGVMTTKGKFA